MAKRSGKPVLFLGTANHDRCRVAEILFNATATRMGLPWSASSRGLAPERSGRLEGTLARSAVTAIRAKGVSDPDAETRLPRPVTSDDLDKAAVVVGVNESEHRPLLQERFPTWSGPIEYWQVEITSGAYEQIEREVNALIARLLGGGERPTPPTTQSLTPPPVVREPFKKPVTAKVGRETAGRRGKGVTTVFDLPLDEAKLRELAATLKNRCGTGGTVKDGRIEIQGDQRERITAVLEEMGYRVKRVGG